MLPLRIPSRAPGGPSAALWQGPEAATFTDFGPLTRRWVQGEGTSPLVGSGAKPQELASLDLLLLLLLKENCILRACSQVEQNNPI